MCAAVPVRALLQLPLYWAWNANLRVYTEVGGLLEVWEPRAPRWAPRMHVPSGTENKIFYFNLGRGYT